MNKIEIATANLIHKIEEHNEVYTPVGLLKPNLFDYLYKKEIFKPLGWDDQMFIFKDYKGFERLVSEYDNGIQNYFTPEGNEFVRPPRLVDVIVSNIQGKRTYYKLRTVSPSEATQAAMTPKMVQAYKKGKKLRNTLNEDAAKPKKKRMDKKAREKLIEQLAEQNKLYKEAENKVIERVGKFRELQNKMQRDTTAYVNRYGKDISFVLYP